MNSIKAQIRKLFEYYQDRKAWFKSLFDIVPVSRKYDNWYYWDGNLMSKYDVFIDPRLSYNTMIKNRNHE